MNFDEIENLKLSSEETSAFKRLLGNNDFQIFQDYVEKKIMKMTYSLITGTFVEGQTKNEYLDELRGFARNWKKIKSSINFKEDEKQD